MGVKFNPFTGQLDLTGSGANPIVTDLVTLTGVPANSTDLGTFTGSIISDGDTIKQALQELESFIEAIPSPFYYAGTWAASTNTPTLVDGVGTSGAVYYVIDSGTVDFGAGPLVFNAGDKVAYNGSTWDKWDMTDNVVSVAGKTGVVTLVSTDLTDFSTAVAAIADVKGPASSTDNAITRFDGTTGKLIQNSTATLDDSGNITANTIIGGSGTNVDPTFSVPTGGGKAGLYFGANGATLTYNTLDVVSWVVSSFRTNVPFSLFVNTSANGPGIFFINDNNTGWFRPAANQWGWSASSTQVINLSSTGLDVTGAISATGTATVANVIDSGLTADTVVYANGSKQLTSSAVTPTQLSYVDATSSIQTQLDGKVDTSSVIAINKGGTGQTTAQDAIDALLPSQTGNSGKFITTNGTTSSWASISSPGDISEGSFTGLVNNTANQTITGLAFSNAVVRSFKAQVSIALTATADQFAVYELNGIQRGADWQISQSLTGDEITDVIFNISTLGQVQVSIGNVAGFASAAIKFRATTTSV